MIEYVVVYAWISLFADAYEHAWGEVITTNLAVGDKIQLVAHSQVLPEAVFKTCDKPEWKL